MKLKYTKFLGLMAILGTVAGLVITGVVIPISPLLAIPFVLLAIGSFVLFVKFVYHFINYGTTREIADEDVEETGRKES